jgi:hypothetical protein
VGQPGSSTISDAGSSMRSPIPTSLVSRSSDQWSRISLGAKTEGSDVYREIKLSSKAWRFRAYQLPKVDWLGNPGRCLVLAAYLPRLAFAMLANKRCGRIHEPG